jgi:hypothetical protein
MQTAPAFQCTYRWRRRERAVIATVLACVGAAVAAWLWSHVDAAAGPAGRGALPWLVVVPTAAAVAAAAGWAAASRACGSIHWHRQRWTLHPEGGAPLDGTLAAELDLGSWMLLRFRPADGGGSAWLAVARAEAGSGWHALRATLFMPGRVQPGDARRSART